MGMSYELYWYGDVWLVEAYRKAEMLRHEQKNEMAWLQGMYTAHALSATVGNMFKNKGATANEYPQKPLPLRPDNPKKKKTKADEESEVAFAKAYMANMQLAGKNWGK